MEKQPLIYSDYGTWNTLSTEQRAYAAKYLFEVAKLAQNCNQFRISKFDRFFLFSIRCLKAPTSKKGFRFETSYLRVDYWVIPEEKKIVPHKNCQFFALGPISGEVYHFFIKAFKLPKNDFVCSITNYAEKYPNIIQKEDPGSDVLRNYETLQKKTKVENTSEFNNILDLGGIDEEF